MTKLHFTEGVTIDDLFGLEVVPGANPNKTVLRRKGDVENASYVLVDGVEPDVYHAFAHVVQVAAEASQWADMENYVRFGLAGEQDRPVWEVLDAWTESRDAMEWLEDEMGMRRGDVRYAADKIESFGRLYESEYERLAEASKHAPLSVVVNVMSGEEAEVVSFDPEHLTYEVRREDGTTCHWDADSVEAPAEVHVAPPHAEFYMDNAGWLHTFVLAENDEVLYCSHLPGEGYAWEYATALAKDPEAWRGWDADWSQEAGSDVVEDLGSCRDLASAGLNQVVAWEPYIDPMQRVNYWENEEGAFLGFAAVPSASPVATRETHLTYDLDKEEFAGEEIGPDGWVDLGEADAFEAARAKGFDRFVDELSGRMVLVAGQKGGLCAGEVLQKLHGAGPVDAKRVPSKDSRAIVPEAAEKAARDQAAATKAASTKARDKDKAMKLWERTNHF